MKRQGKLISLDGSDQIDVSYVFHCDGLLLCVLKDKARLVVWNLHLGQTRCIIELAHNNFHRLESYSCALGYTDRRNYHKILRVGDSSHPTFFEFKIYDLISDSWRDLDHVTQDLFLYSYKFGLSLKGNIYWFGTKRYHKVCKNFLQCFDFTRERFGLRLHVPFHWRHGDIVSLSSVREEQLAVLFQRRNTKMMEIWVTTKVELDAVSWNTKVFLAVHTIPLTHSYFQFETFASSFFIDEENKVVVVVDRDKNLSNPTRVVAYIFGVDGSFNEVDLGESTYEHCYPLVCSYVPSLVQLN